jgi:hypothetical protein
VAASDRFAELLRDARFGVPGADAALLAWMDANPSAPGEQRLRGWNRLCEDFGVLGWNRARERACVEEAKLKPATGGDDDAAMAKALADVPPIRAIGSARVPLIWNRFGSQSADVVVNGVTTSFFVDTGAEITVVTESVAGKIGVRIVAEKVSVGTSTADVFGRLGVIDLMRIGESWVENVPVLVLPDAQLTIGGVHRIDGILGLPLFNAFGRIAWVEGGTVLAFGEAAPKPRPGSPRLYRHEDGLGVPVATPLGIHGAHLDTGANNSDWHIGGLPLIDKTALNAAKEQIMRIGGAGGVVELKQRSLPRLDFMLAAQPVSLTDLTIADADPHDAARIGMDAVSQFGTFILDFETMTVDARLKTAEEKQRPGWRPLTAADFMAPGEAPDKDP